MKIKKYGLLKKDLAIVKIMMWSGGTEPMEIYFKYGLKHWRKHKMRNKVKNVLATPRVKWAYENDFIAFAKTKKEIKTIKERVERGDKMRIKSPIFYKKGEYL